MYRQDLDMMEVVWFGNSSRVRGGTYTGFKNAKKVSLDVFKN